MISFHLNIYIINYVIVVLHKVQRFGGPCLMCIFYVLYYSFHSYMFFCDHTSLLGSPHFIHSSDLLHEGQAWCSW
jgi:hypothetical protein